ncbi:MAG: beta-glucosidase [Candidatus Promineifilaceae bacterium]|jgi:beta-glucosidase
MKDSYRFPEAFRWGAATAAYQIEGAVAEDGRKPSVWDTFCERPGAVITGDSGAVACDHYHRYEEDIALMGSLGIKHYRCSLAWPRIIPDGRGAVNQAGLDFYKRLFDCCAKHDVTPHVTLFHWDTPQALEDRYRAWLSRDIVDDFADYAAVVVKALGDHVNHWITLNEIACFTLYSHHDRTHPHPFMTAPGTKVAHRRDPFQALHHACLAHGRAVQAIRANTPRPCHVSIAENVTVAVPWAETPADIEAAQKSFQLGHCNGAALYPIMTGDFSPLWLEHNQELMPEMQGDDLKTIHQPLDEMGLNIYSGETVRAADNPRGFEGMHLPQGYPRLDMPWLNIVPHSLYWGVRHVAETLGFKGGIYISENGCAAQDTIDVNGEVMDLDRILYLKSHLQQLHRASAEGYNVSGYFQWSFLDNFEWCWGYSKRFGIIRTNYETQERIPKTSAKWYAECIRQNRVV